MADIFLSYKREDRAKVEPLVQALERCGWSVWWDTRIEAGAVWDEVIERELAAAKCVVVVWSKVSIESRWVRTEAHEGLERGCLVPVVIDGAKPPLAFRLVQATDLTEWRGDPAHVKFAEVVGGIRKILPSASKDSSRPSGNHVQSAQAYISGGEAHLNNNDYKNAFADFTKAIEIDPASAKAYEGRGRAYRGLNDVDRALADFTKSVAIDPTNHWVYIARGALYYDCKDYDRSIADFTKANEIHPKTAASRNGLGNAYLGKNDCDRAIAEHNKAIEISPEVAVYQYDRGHAYELRGRHGDKDRAIADYRAAHRISPEASFVLVAFKRLGIPH